MEKVALDIAYRRLKYVSDWRLVEENQRAALALKTEFVLQYMSEPKLRAKVRRGLLKVEQLHALARTVYYGQRGRISAREVYDQMNAVLVSHPDRARRMHDGGAARPKEMGERSDASGHAGTHTKS